MITFRFSKNNLSVSYQTSSLSTILVVVVRNRWIHTVDNRTSPHQIRQNQSPAWRAQILRFHHHGRDCCFIDFRRPWRSKTRCWTVQLLTWISNSYFGRNDSGPQGFKSLSIISCNCSSGVGISVCWGGRPGSWSFIFSFACSFFRI